MKVFTAHEPPDGGGSRFEGITFVKEGFSWPALFVPMFWLIWHRMWWVLLAWLAISTALGAVGELVEESGFIVGVLSVLFALWFALEANALRRWSLARKGWHLLGVAAGRDQEEAEQSFFGRHLAQSAGPARGSTQATTAAPRVPPVARQSGAPGSGAANPGTRHPGTRHPDTGGKEPVIGLFPQPE